MRDEFLKVFPGLSVFVFEREIDFLEKKTQDVQLILHASNHQVTDPSRRIHIVTYSN